MVSCTGSSLDLQGGPSAHDASHSAVCAASACTAAHRPLAQARAHLLRVEPRVAVRVVAAAEVHLVHARAAADALGHIVACGQAVARTASVSRQ